MKTILLILGFVSLYLIACNLINSILEQRTLDEHLQQAFQTGLRANHCKLSGVWGKYGEFHVYTCDGECTSKSGMT
jgi:hypothetical protein